MKTPFQVVGHRGFPQRYPENSLQGIVAAAQAGAPFVELDIQISRDGVPVVFHDEVLDRVTEKNGEIWEYSVSELSQMSCHEPQRFQEAFNPTPISTLQEVCEALVDFDVHVFVEVKEKSLDHISREDMLAQIVSATASIMSRITVISFDIDMLYTAERVFPVGWGLREFDDAHLQKAKKLQPQVLIFDVTRLSDDAVLWPGPWQWFLYDIVDLEKALFWTAKGASYIETWDVKALLSKASV